MIIPLERLPGVPSVACDYMNGSSEVLPFFSGHYKDRGAYEQKAEKVVKQLRTDRQSLVSALLEQNMSFGCGELTLENIKKLSSSDVFVVATGQQVGLFTGPLYTIYKALSTVKMAQDLAQQLRVPVLPLFYLVSEDHDYDEVKWLGEEGWCPVCHSNLMMEGKPHWDGTSYAIECAMCGAGGSLEVKNGNARFVVAEDGLKHCRIFTEGRYNHLLEITETHEHAFKNIKEIRSLSKRYKEFKLPGI